MRIWNRTLPFGTNAVRDLFRETVSDSLQPKHNPRHLLFVQNFSEGPLYLGSELDITSGPAIGYRLDPGKEFRMEMSHDRLWAASGDIALPEIRVMIVVL